MKSFLLICLLIMVAVLGTEGRLFGPKINFCRRNSQKVCQKYANADCRRRSLFGRGKVSKKAHSRCVRMARRFCRKPVLPRSASRCRKLAKRRCGGSKIAALCRTQHENQCKQMARCDKRKFALARAKRRLRRKAVHTVVRRPFRKRSTHVLRSSCKGLAPKRCLSLARVACGTHKRRRRCRRVFYSNCRRPVTKTSCSRDAVKQCGTSRLRGRCRNVHKNHCRKINSNCKCRARSKCRGSSRRRCKALSRRLCRGNRRCRNVFYSSCRRPKPSPRRKCGSEARRKCGRNRRCRRVHRRHCRKIARECKCRKTIKRRTKTVGSCAGNSHKMCFKFAKQACGLGKRNLRCRRVFYGHCKIPMRVESNKCGAQAKELCGSEKKQWKCRHVHVKHCRKVARECKCKKIKTNCIGKSSRVCRKLSYAACGGGRRYKKCRNVFHRNCRAPNKTSESCSGQARRFCGGHASQRRCRSVHRRHCRKIQKQCKCRKKKCLGLGAKKCAGLARALCPRSGRGKRCRRVFRRHCRSPDPVKDCVGQAKLECGGNRPCRRVHLEHCRKIRRNCKCRRITPPKEPELPPQPKCPRKCKVHGDCVSSDACHVGHCAKDGVCRYRDTCGASKCNARKCDDNNPCTLDKCTKNGCEHTDICNGHKCANGKMCDDKNLLTKDLCGKNNKCHHVPVCQGENNRDKCWTYKAEVTGFWFEEKTGQSNPIAKCVKGKPKPGAKALSQCRSQGVKCYVDGDCQPPKSSGLVGHCDNWKCTFYKKCKSDNACAAVKGNSPCITSKCHTKYGVCSWKAKCEDSNPCTLDRCTVTGKNSHKCMHEQVKCSVGECPSLARTVKQSLAIEKAKCDPKKGCGVCALDSACDDGIACTIDKCVNFKCVHTPVSGKNIDPWLNLWCDPNVNGFNVRDQTDPRVVAANRQAQENQ